MADHSKPTTASAYASFVTELDARLDEITLGLDPAYTSPTNIPTNSMRFSSAASKWQRYNGSTWVDAATTYAIGISGNAATVTNGLYSSGSYADPTWLTSLAGTKVTGNISGNAGSATVLATARTINGVSFNGSANISINLSSNLTFNNAGAGAASGVNYSGSTATTISYNTIGAPSTGGANASGTWAISISGNAATATTAASAAAVTNGVYTTGDQSIAGNKTFSGVSTFAQNVFFANNFAQVRGASSAMWEMHVPGVAARAWHLDSAGVTRLSTTNGGGAASVQLISVDGSGNTVVAGNLKASTTGVIFPDNTTQATAAVSSIGAGQTWQDVTAGRVAGTVYTNSTGRPIMVSVYSSEIDYAYTLNAFVGSVKVAFSAGGAGGDARRTGNTSFIVPPAATYYVTYSGGFSTLVWVELR